MHSGSPGRSAMEQLDRLIGAVSIGALAVVGALCAVVLPWLMFGDGHGRAAVIVVVVAIDAVAVTASQGYIHRAMGRQDPGYGRVIAAPIYCLFIVGGVLCLALVHAFSDLLAGSVSAVITASSAVVLVRQCLGVRRRLSSSPRLNRACR